MNTHPHRGPLAGCGALVTGASRGIGAETARILAARGAQVAVNYREKARRAQAVVASIRDRGGEAVALGADLTDAAALKAMAVADVAVADVPSGHTVYVGGPDYLA